MSKIYLVDEIERDLNYGYIGEPTDIEDVFVGDIYTVAETENDIIDVEHNCYIVLKSDDLGGYILQTYKYYMPVEELKNKQHWFIRKENSYENFDISDTCLVAYLDVEYKHDGDL